ncbi:MAG: hypothetical protein ACFFBP_06845 [Promethearchaeota archaeon]
MNQPPKKKIRSRHKVNIKKERLKQKKHAEKEKKKLLKSREDLQPKQKQKSVKETALDIRITRETKIYWIRGATGAFSALILRLIGFVGFPLLIWLIALLFLVPFVINYLLGYKLDKEEWTWKNVLKPGLGLFFFLFMFVGVIIETIFVVFDIGIRITFTGIYF